MLIQQCILTKVKPQLQVLLNMVTKFNLFYTKKKSFI